VNSRIRILCLVLVALSGILGGCTETRFAALPGDTLDTCDPRWKGLWGPGDEEPNNRTAIFVDDTCHVVVLDQPEKTGPLKRVSLPVNFVHVDGKDYVIVADSALKDLVKIGPVYGVDPVPEKAFYFLRYQAGKDRIELFPVDSERVAKQIIDRKLDGTVSKTQNELHAFVSGDRAHMLEILRHGSIFASKPDIKLARLKQSVGEFERSVMQMEHKKAQ
jgi:hypothetical protein